MKKIMPKLFVFAVTALLFLANVVTAFGSNCTLSSYQPEVPEALRK